MQYCWKHQQKKIMRGKHVQMSATPSLLKSNNSYQRNTKKLLDKLLSVGPRFNSPMLATIIDKPILASNIYNTGILHSLKTNLVVTNLVKC